MSQQQTADAAQRILIIDDNPVNLRVLGDHLRQRGFMVTTAQDGEEGLDRARLVKPDLILLDIMMPGINGLETCRRLKASDETREIPVIFKTALTDTETKIAGFEAGGVDYVTSPIQIEEVMARVQTHLTLHTIKKHLEQRNSELQQQVEVRQRAEKALEQARDELEERVQQRTAELHRLNRELRAISECNQMLLRATDEQALINEICRIICEDAGYRMAWVGYAEQDEAKTMSPVAWAGVEEGYLRTARISWSEETERGRGPSGTAIRSGKTCYGQDLMTDVSLAPWREDALKLGYRSTIALPLKDEDGISFGTLTIYSSEPNAFSAEEIRLLEELSGDLAFGITTIRTRAERQRAEQEVSLLRFALDNVREAAFLVGEDARFRYFNEEACRVLGYTREELLGMGVLDLVPDEHWPEHWSDLKAQQSLSFERHLRTKDGRKIPVEINANYFEYRGIAYNLALVRDISERKQAEEMMLEARVTERTRIARDLHDTLLQSFQAVLPRFQAAVYKLPENATDSRKLLEEAIDRGAEAIREGRDAVHGLRLSLLENDDLARSIRTIGEEVASAESNGTPTPFRVLVEGTPRTLHPMLRDEVYRIAAESLRNAFRHAAARNVEVEIRYDQSYFRLRVQDDGKGICSDILRGDGRQGHYGLRGMNERAELVGGKLTIRSELNTGTEIDLTIPASTAYANSVPQFWNFGKRP